MASVHVLLPAQRYVFAVSNGEAETTVADSSADGFRRYKELGHRFDGEWGKFGRLLHERKDRGLLTVGFSAGADQLCESLCHRAYDEHDGKGFGLVRNTTVWLHHDAGRDGDLAHSAARFPDHFAFGLPNDSGLNHDFGTLPSGNTRGMSARAEQFGSEFQNHDNRIAVAQT